MTEKKTGGVKKGHDFGGIRDIDGLKSRCEVDDLTDCWIWKLAKNKGRYPKVSVVVDGRAMVTTGVRAAMLAAGVVFKPGQIAYHFRCTTHDCVNPAHIRVGSHADKWAHIRESGWLKGDPIRKAKNTRIKRGASHLTPHVDEIRASNAPAEELAQRLNCCVAAIRHIRAYRTHKPEVSGASVFAWRPM